MAAVQKLQFPVLVGLLQVVFFILFGLFADFDEASKPGAADDLAKFAPRYESEQFVRREQLAVFQDTHVMIFIGFGFLMTFLKRSVFSPSLSGVCRYGFSAVSLNMLLACITIEWGLILRGFFTDDFKTNGKFVIGTEQ